MSQGHGAENAVEVKPQTKYDLRYYALSYIKIDRHLRSCWGVP